MMIGTDDTQPEGVELAEPSPALESAVAALVDLATSIWALDRAQSPSEACSRANVALCRSAMSAQGLYRRLPVPTVHIRSSLSRFHAPFVVLHELGHHLLHQIRSDRETRRYVPQQSRNLIDWIETGSRYEELACDLFAASILLDQATVEQWSIAPHQPSMAALIDLTVARKLPIPLVFWRVRKFLSAPWSMAAVDAPHHFDALTVQSIVGTSATPLARGWRMVPDSPPLLVNDSGAQSRSLWRSPDGTVRTVTGSSAVKPGGGAYLLVVHPSSR